jgi:hypothetical protein
MVRNTNDGSQRAPALRLDISAGHLWTMPADCSMPRDPDQHVTIRNAGFGGLQGGNPARCRELGLGFTSSGRVVAVGEAERIAREALSQRADCATLHVGTGFEDDDEVDRLIEDILTASAATDLPLYVETHRATVTQDMHRTLRIARRFPEVRFNGDFSHWYTGQEMVYGDISAKFDRLEPVFSRTRFIHARIGDPGCIQVDVGDGNGADGQRRPHVAHFMEMWTRSFVGFLRSAGPGDFFCFTGELLFPQAHYARVVTAADGRVVEEGDRWQQALLYNRLASDCFAEAKRRMASGAIAAASR